MQVTLRDLASQLPPPGTPGNAETVWAFVRARLKQAALEDFAPFLREGLLNGGGLVLLDGLDEVPDADTRRKQIKQAVQDFAATFSKCRFLVTSRTYASQRQDWKLDDFAESPPPALHAGSDPRLRERLVCTHGRALSPDRARRTGPRRGA